jgi:GntR family transcriptional regulator
MAAKRQSGNVQIQELDTTSLSERARGAILEAILDGRFETRLPNEDELARMLNVSRTTIRSALQGLEQEGMITRRRAIGTRINHHVGPATLGLQRLVGFDRLLKETHRDVRVDVTWERGLPPEDFRAVFETDDDSISMSKSYLADDGLALHIRDVVPWSNLHTEELDDELPASLFEFSRRFATEPIDHAVVQTVPLTKRKDSTQLQLDEGAPFIRLHETHYSSGAHVLGHSIIDVDDRYIRLEVFRREHA